VIQSVTALTVNTIRAAFNVPCTTDLANELAENCTTGKLLNVTTPVSNGNNIDYTVVNQDASPGPVISPGDVVNFTAAGVTMACIGTSYIPTIANFGGVDTFLHRPVASSAELNEGTISMICNFINAGSGNDKIFDIGSPSSVPSETTRFRISYGSQDLGIILSNFAAGVWTTIATGTVGVGPWAYGEQTHIYIAYRNEISAGAGNSIVQFWINGVLAVQAPFLAGQEAKTLSFRGADHPDVGGVADNVVIGARHNTDSPLNLYAGGLSELLSYPVFMDASANIASFFNTADTDANWVNGKPINLGPNGIVNGVTPTTYLGGTGYLLVDYNNGLNRGSSGNFTRAGSLIT